MSKKVIAKGMLELCGRNYYCEVVNNNGEIERHLAGYNLLDDTQFDECVAMIAKECNTTKRKVMTAMALGPKGMTEQQRAEQMQKAYYEVILSCIDKNNSTVN